MHRLTWLLVTLWLVPAAASAAEPNTLTPSESKSGWKLLFDGKSTAGWRNYKKDAISSGWKVENGELVRSEKGAGDIVTEQEFDNFELSLEFKVSQAGNSGVMFHVGEGQGPGRLPEGPLRRPAALGAPRRTTLTTQLLPSPRGRGFHLGPNRIDS